MLDRSIKIFLLCLIILGVFLGIYEGIWEQGAKKVAKIQPTMQTEPDDIYLEVIWDASGSMWGREYGVEKIIRSKEVLKNLVNEIPGQVNMGLRIFGARKVGDLQDSFLALPLNEENNEDILNFIANVKPLGKSPIGYSLSQALNDLKTVRGKKFILLVSDGIDNGDIPPEKVLEDLKENGIALHVVHIGEMEDKNLKARLRYLASSTGGCYFTYNDKEQVIATLKQSF